MATAPICPLLRTVEGCVALEYVLRIADLLRLILGHRLSEWCGHGPVLEEDIALTNVALDLIGQARSLYAYAGALEGKGRGEDQFAFERNENEFRNVTIDRAAERRLRFHDHAQFSVPRVSARAVGSASSIC